MDFSLAKVMVFFVIFAIMVVGYLVGSIKIKGITLGTAGVFLIALLYGHFAEEYPDAWFSVEIPAFIQTFGLILFVSSVGFIAGPSFFRNLVKNVKSYVLLGAIIIVSGALTCAGCILVSGTTSGLQVGLLSGSLTTTPGFSAAKDAVADKEIVLPEELTTWLAEEMEDNFFDMKKVEEANKIIKKEFKCKVSEEDFEALNKLDVKGDANKAYEKHLKEAISSALVNQVSVGHAVAYPFGVIGVVLFIQIIPKLLKANMEEERKKLQSVDSGHKEKKTLKLLDFDEFGLTGFSLALISGLLLGSIVIPLPGGASFSLGTTGGPLIMCLVFGHFGRIGKVNFTVKKEVLELFRELGLVLFLIGAGVEGGAEFLQTIKDEGVILFVYGAAMTIIPMILGYVFARYVMKLSLLNNLGSITGGMTSTPALGTLIGVAGTADVASAYAATYPIALVLVVLASQFLCIWL